MLTARRRRVLEDVRVKEEWLNPGGRQLRACREANIKLWRANNRRLSPVLITTRRDQRDRADVVTAIRVSMNASVQSRRDADEKCPGERCKQNGSQQEHARKFVNALSCSSASELVTMAAFAQAIFRGAVAAASCDWRLANRRVNAMRYWRITVAKVRGEAPRTARKAHVLPRAAVLEQMLISGFRVRCDSRLERNTMIGPGRFRRCAGADLFRPFGVLVVWVLI